MRKFKVKNEAIDVYLQHRKSREFVGRLTRENSKYLFTYDDAYIYGRKAIPIGPDLPISSKVHTSVRKLFPSFEDRIPSKRNPAYKDYCKAVGIDPQEKDQMVLLGTLGQKGPSSFVFVPVFNDGFDKKSLEHFRKELKLTIREFAETFDFAPATIHRIETGESSGKDALKRMQIYFEFPETALFELKRSGFKINDDKRAYVERVLQAKLKKHEEHKQDQSGS